MNKKYADKPKEIKYSVSIEYRHKGALHTISDDGITTLDGVGHFIKEQLSLIDHDIDADIQITNYKE